MRQINYPIMNPRLNALSIGAIDMPAANQAQRRYEINGFNTAYNSANRQSPYPALFTSLPIFFHDGPVFLDAPLNGVTVESLIAVCMDRLASLQTTPEGCAEYHMALESLRLAMESLSRRNEMPYMSQDAYQQAV
jgi:hypothetical protein